MNTIVTGADQSHGPEVVRCVESVRRWVPNWRCVVWDLGLLPEDIEAVQAAHPDAEVRKYDYAKYPAWHDITQAGGEYGWKPGCVWEVCEEQGEPGLMAWIDAGGKLAGNIAPLIQYARQYGVWARKTVGTLDEYTHPQTLDRMGITGQWRKAANYCSGQIIWSLPKGREIARLWAEYALDRDTFAPVGSLKHPRCKAEKHDPRYNHRQDQSVFNGLLTLWVKAGNELPEGPEWRDTWKHRQDFSKRPRHVK